MNLFKGRKLCVATMHHKESVIGPVFENAFEVTYTAANNLNTDVFGTFTGETERTASPLETARQKCLAAFHLTGLDLVIASEGSFGAHPHYGFVPCDEEVLLLKDFKNDLEISCVHLSTETNFHSTEVQTLSEAQLFLNNVGFPEHAVIIKGRTAKNIHKGIDQFPAFETLFQNLIKQQGRLVLETDMRAHKNPTRRKVILEAVHALVKKIQSICPNCQAPGFAVAQAVAGLPCGYCHLPTRSTLKQLASCEKCGHIEEKLFPHGKQQEDPMYCDFCNP